MPEGHRFTSEEDKVVKKIIKFERSKGYSLQRAKRIAYGHLNKLRRMRA